MRRIGIKTMAITREELYKEVWAEPMLVVAARYEVSGSFLARVCRRMHVPCPPRGYWAKSKAGQRLKRPRLPDAEPGDEITWERGVGGKRLPPPLPTTAPRRNRRGERSSASTDGRHRHLAGIADHFGKADALDVGFLKPSKRLMADIYASKKSLATIIEVTSKFYCKRSGPLAGA